MADLHAGDLDPSLQSSEFVPEVHRGFAASIAYELVDDALGGHTVGSQPILPGFVVVVGLVRRPHHDQSDYDAEQIAGVAHLPTAPQDFHHGHGRSSCPLPMYAQLADMYLVSVSTAQAALRLLRDRGLVEGHQGKGTYVTDGETITAWRLRRRQCWSTKMTCGSSRRPPCGRGVRSRSTSGRRFRIAALRARRWSGDWDIPEIGFGGPVSDDDVRAAVADAEDRKYGSVGHSA
ncbi:GntR family transcriptional regulator [Micromonospora sp. LOL_021]|uniref:GntR family transcriptional regulator n=1 Tax=Micromonospora sp. LOL_021 TaxID=3345417 RepID=UPI003A8A1831